MKVVTLRKKILGAFFSVIFVLAGFIAILRYYVIRQDIVKQAQEEVNNTLNVARRMYDDQLERMLTCLNLISTRNDWQELYPKIGMDYLYVVNDLDKAKVNSEIVQAAFVHGKQISGTRIIDKDELLAMGQAFYDRAEMKIIDTPKATPMNRKILENAISMECAIPIYDGQNKLTAVMYGGKIINRDFALVDNIRDLVFARKNNSEKNTVTVTIFQDDVRVTTNVLDKVGNRAIGTRVSAEVYNTVVKYGQRWVDRAFVVTDWYLTAYEPIRNIQGNIIGILYVGILEKPFKALEKRFQLGVLSSLVLAIILAILFSYILATHIIRPMNKVLLATQKISQGETNHRVNFQCPIDELNTLVSSFNIMADKLHEREKNIKDANEKLIALNKSYIAMVSFVSHELKGLLGSIVMNVYSVKDGYLGELNDRQKKVMEATARSLDHFESVVKDYLNLSRIEEGNLTLNKTEFNFNEDVLSSAIEYFKKECQEKYIILENKVVSNLKIYADSHLLTIVCNNLIGNAVKYGITGGKIIINADFDKGNLKVSIYNDGTPIKLEEAKTLFRRFARLDVSQEIKGTGLGLFIVKEIIEKHGGSIWIESSDKGNSFIFTIPKM